MEQMVSAALVGTARRDIPAIETHSAIDRLLPSLPSDSARRLLLAAGLLSLYAEAGRIPGSLPPIEPAPEETLDPCSKGAADALSAILEPGSPPPALLTIVRMDLQLARTGLGAQHDDLLPEALELMRQRNLRLRHILLPRVLRARPEPLRRALLPVIGERGRWLARLNPDWAWVLTMDGDASPVPEPEGVQRSEKELIKLLTKPPAQPDVVSIGALAAVARPWPEGLSRAYVDVLRRSMARLADQKPPHQTWLNALIPGARCIAPSTIDDALALFPPPEIQHKQLQIWRIALQAAGEKLALRRRVIQELTA